MRDTLCHSFINIGLQVAIENNAQSTGDLPRRTSGRSTLNQSSNFRLSSLCCSACNRFSTNLSLIGCQYTRSFLFTRHARHGTGQFYSSSHVLPAEASLQRVTKKRRKPLPSCALESPMLVGSNEEEIGSQNGSAVHTVSLHSMKQYAFAHSNTVGILGGMAALATVDFMRKVVIATLPDSNLVPFLVCIDPYVQKFAPVVGAKESTRASAAKLTDADESSPLAALLEKRRFLEQAGARLIVMPCHASHMWYDQLVEGCSVPFLHIADCVVEELKAMDLRPLEAGSRVKIGVLGTEATLAAGFYQERLRLQGFDVAVPDKSTMEHAGVPGIRALHRRDMEGARNLLRIAVHVLLVNAVNKVVFACHDMPSAFEPNDPLLPKCIDPIDALARATVKWAQATEATRV